MVLSVCAPLRVYMVAEVVEFAGGLGELFVWRTPFDQELACLLHELLTT